MGGLSFELRSADPEAARELGRACGVGAATAQVLLHRGLVDEARAREFLTPRLAGLTPPDGMADREVAAERIARAIRARERIAVFGDYDVDGTTSAAILADVIEALGGDVVALVASRFDGGYGFSARGLARCLDAGARLIVTCDCGSSDHERIETARRRGVDVVVVDHHLVPAEPLPALAFLNPHRPECRFPYKGLASAGLALSVGAAVRAELRAELDLRAWLDLVALGTIADCAPLDGDNRRLVRAGLKLLSEPRRPGVIALREVARMAPALTSAVDVAYRLAPRLNAAGRLGDPSITLALLRSRTPEEARGLAARIEQLNDERKAVERRTTELAVAHVTGLYGEEPLGGIVAAGEGWHRGVVGITAARLVERFDAPVIAISIDDGIGHGSCRAPDGFPLHDAVSRCADLLDAFGGHQAACGLSVRAERIDALRAAFADACVAVAPSGAGRTAPLADVCLDGGVFDVPRASDVLGLEPIGEANAEPVFALRGARVEQKSAVGAEGAHLKLCLRVGCRSLWAFGYDLGPRVGRLSDAVDALGYVRLDTFRGGQAVELRLLAVG
jgi:single-stranded-DNA-specific exonuclease